MELSSKILSNLTVYMKYAKYLEKENRRETWEEIVTRNMNMHVKKFPQLENEIKENFKLVFEKKVLPSLRSLQFGGKPIEIAPFRLYNCSFVAIDDRHAFHEIMLLLLAGCGVGYSVQKHHVDELPCIRKPTQKKRRHLIGDSIEGWSDAIKVLMKSYFYGLSEVDFDYREIRQKGTRLVTSGGKAPGPQPLKDCIHNIRKILDNIKDGEKLRPIEVHEIICYIADSVLSGGIRRAALLAAFSLDDEEMLTCKYGKWYEAKPHLARANNAAVLLRHRISEDIFKSLWEKIKISKSGEPSFIFTNDPEILVNPCAEVSLRSKNFCNLTEVNVTDIESQEDLNSRAKAASFIGTLQASYTDFHYLREAWKKNTEKEALLGIGLNGIASNSIIKYNIIEAALVAKEENKRVAKVIGINSAARITTVKPSGTSALVCGCSSGIHAWHDQYYIRRLRINKTEPIYIYLRNKIPQLIEDDFERPFKGAIISIPIKAPENAVLRTKETPLELLERVKYIYKKWIKPGHVVGTNTHSVSCTVALKNDEWDKVGNWLWNNKKYYNNISVLPYDDNTYVQMPFESCTKEKYEDLIQYVQQIDLFEIKEYDDNTEQNQILACSAGSCEIV